MPAKAATKPSTRGSKEVPVKSKQDEDEDINRLPDSSSDDDSSANIQATNFQKGSSKAKDGISAFSKKQDKPATNGVSLRNENGRYKGTARLAAPRSSPAKASNSPSSSAGSAKRKSPISSGHGAGMRGEFGQVNVKKVKKTFGSSQPRSSQQKSLSQKSKQKDSFKMPRSIPSSPIPEFPPAMKYQKIELDIWDSTPSSTGEFRRHSLSPKKEEEPEEPKIVFQMPGLDDLEDSFALSSQSQEPDSTLPKLPKLPEDEADLPPATQKFVFKTFDLDDDLVEKVQKAKAILGDDNDKASATEMDDDQFATMTQRAHCPMCNAPVEPEDIRAFGKMTNIRAQEKFCRAHRTKTAKQKWEEEEYPTIKWEKLDGRITKHHALIKKLIKGESSHYREQMEEKIKAGKDRSLMKMTTNLTPGYYGARGLRAISENIMHKFTPLLKKRMVEDELMSARGVTPYVQSVLVPEIASRLIMADMKVSLERAREILAESTEVGELLNEEVRDVVKRSVDDSDDGVDEDED